MIRYLLTPDAEMDLIDVWFYSAQKWDREQANKYVGALYNSFQKLVTGDARAKPCSRLFPESPDELMLYLSGKHYIIFRQRGEFLEVLAVIHSARYQVLTEFFENY